MLKTGIIDQATFGCLKQMDRFAIRFAQVQALQSHKEDKKLKKPFLDKGDLEKAFAFSPKLNWM